MRACAVHHMLRHGRPWCDSGRRASLFRPPGYSYGLNGYGLYSYGRPWRDSWRRARVYRPPERGDACFSTAISPNGYDAVPDGSIAKASTRPPWERRSDPCPRHFAAGHPPFDLSKETARSTCRALRVHHGEPKPQTIPSHQRHQRQWTCRKAKAAREASVKMRQQKNTMSYGEQACMAGRQDSVTVSGRLSEPCWMVSDDYIGHNSIGHNNIGHNYKGHNYIGHGVG